MGPRGEGRVGWDMMQQGGKQLRVVMEYGRDPWTIESSVIALGVDAEIKGSLTVGASQRELPLNFLLSRLLDYGNLIFVKDQKTVSIYRMALSMSVSLDKAREFWNAIGSFYYFGGASRKDLSIFMDASFILFGSRSVAADPNDRVGLIVTESGLMPGRQPDSEKSDLSLTLAEISFGPDNRVEKVTKATPLLDLHGTGRRIVIHYGAFPAPDDKTCYLVVDGLTDGRTVRSVDLTSPAEWHITKYEKVPYFGKVVQEWTYNQADFKSK
jgi:hypothetical protein